MNRFRYVDYIYFTDVEKVNLPNGDFIFVRDLYIFFESGFYTIIPFSTFTVGGLDICFEDLF
jgi:hypothetical protein